MVKHAHCGMHAHMHSSLYSIVCEYVHMCLHEAHKPNILSMNCMDLPFLSSRGTPEQARAASTQVSTHFSFLPIKTMLECDPSVMQFKRLQLTFQDALLTLKLRAMFSIKS